MFAFVATVVFAASVSSSVASPSGLKMFEARTDAQAEASSFTLRRDLTESHVTRCKRESARAIDCAAVATGETPAATIECSLRIHVRAVYRSFYWTDIAAITSHHCARTPKERLTYRVAVPAIQAAADKFAGTSTAITSVFRRDELTYVASAKWQRPRTPPNEFIATETCSLEVTAALADGKVSVATEGFLCY
jgi:hypothetical protein